MYNAFLLEPLNRGSCVVYISIIHLTDNFARVLNNERGYSSATWIDINREISSAGPDRGSGRRADKTPSGIAQSIEGNNEHDQFNCV